jgi:hypothetical protein
MQTNEFRVRPVQRFQLTHYQESENASSCRTVGEFPSVESAEEVGVALQALVPGSVLTTIDGRQASYPPKALVAAMAVAVGQEAPELMEFVVVQRGFDIDTRAYYADNEPMALSMKEQAEKEHGTEFRIFSRPVTDPVRLAARGAVPPGA